MATDVPVVSPDDADPSAQVVLPAGIRWRPIAQLPDPFNPEPCSPRPPDLLTPTLAVSVAEDPVEDGDCSITSYVKVTASLTGKLMPSGGRQGHQSIGIDTVWGCFGATLRIAVNPLEKDPGAAGGPVITDFEPQLRDLYQGGTIEDEVLSGSSGQTTVDRATKSIASTTLGLSVTGGYGLGQGNTGKGGNISATGSISGTRSLEMDYDFNTVSGTSSSKRNATTDTISQMCNLLTGYHAGTNCIGVEMYPRPHIAQPSAGPLSDFTPGMRAMEGVQEIIAVVSRPNTAAQRAGVAITVWLDLVYLSPLAATPSQDPTARSQLLPDPRHPGQPLLLHFDTQALRRGYPVPAPGSPPTPDDVAEYAQIFDVGDALEAASAAIDLSAGDSPASPGVTMFRSFTPRHDQERIGSERYGAISDTQIRVDVVQRPDIGVAEAVPQIVKDYVVWVKDRGSDAIAVDVTGNLARHTMRLCTSYSIDGHCITALSNDISDGGLNSKQTGKGAESIPVQTIALHALSLTAEGAHYVGKQLRTGIRSVLLSEVDNDPPG